MPDKPNKYTAQFNEIVKNAHAARSSSPAASIFSSDILSKPINAGPAVPVEQVNPFEAVNFGAKIVDILSRPLNAMGGMTESGVKDLKAVIADTYAPSTVTDEQRQLLDRNPVQQINDIASAGWKGLSGQTHITPGQVLQRENNLSGVGGWLAGFGTDVLMDPLNAINPVAAGTAAVNAVRGLKGLEKIEAPVLSLSRKSKTLAAESTRKTQLNSAVKADLPKDAPSELKKALKSAKTPKEIAEANKQVANYIEHDAIKNRFANIKQELPEVTAPVAPTTVPGVFSQRMAEAQRLMDNTPGMQFDEAWDAADNSLTSVKAAEDAAAAAAKAAEDAKTAIPVAKEAPQTKPGLSGVFDFKPAPESVLPAGKAPVETAVADAVIPKLKSKMASAFDFKSAPDHLLPPKNVVKADAAINTIEDTAKITPAQIPESVLPDVERGIKAAKSAAAYAGGYNAHVQAKMFVRFRNDSVKSVKAADVDRALSSAERNKLITEQVLNKMKAVEEASAAKGAFHFTSAEVGGKKWALKGSDIMETLSQATVRKHIISGTSNVTFSAVMRAAAKSLDLASNTAMTAAEKIAKVSESLATSSIEHGSRASLAKELLNKVPELLNRVTTNEARMGLKAGQDIPALTEKAMKDITDAILGKAPAAIVHAVVDAPKTIAKMGEEIGAASDSIAAANAEVAAKVADEIDPASYAFIQAADKSVALREAGKLPQLKETIRQAAKKAEEITVKEEGLDIPTSAAKTMDDLSDRFATGHFAVMRRLDRITASRASEIQVVKELQRSQGLVGYAGTQIGQFHKGLNQIQKEMPREQILADFSIMRQGGKSANSKLQAAYDLVFGDHSLLGPLWRNGAHTNQINEAIKSSHAGVGKAPKFDDAIAKDAKSLADQHKDWVVADPIDHLSRMYDASRKLIANQTVAITLENNFGSLVPKRGYAKIAAKETDRIASHLNPDMYFPEHVLKGVDYLEWAAGASRNFAGSKTPIGHFIDKIFDPVQNTWKTYATIMRPANHTRNFFGDAALSHLAGMNNIPKWYAAATGILVKKEGSKYSQKVRVGNTTIDYSGDRAYRAMQANGLLPNFRLAEDIDSSTNRVFKALSDNKAVRAGGHASEMISAHGKLAQFLWELSRPENLRIAKSLEHLEAIAARNTRKWHPDSTGLSPFEAKYMKRIIPFYSWIRQAIPLVGEAAITRPGRVMALPKANYNMAIANGVDPASVSDQFPEDGNYPSYMTTNVLGPNDMFGEGTGFNFGSPVESVFGDVLNGYGNSFTTGRAGGSYDNQGKFTGFAPSELISPLIRGPLEMMTGTRFSSGKPIVDKGEYIDQNIPLVSNLASISGYSPTGTVTNALGFGPTNAPTLDPIRAVVRGERAHWLNMNLVNLLTGAGLTQFADPSTERNAMRENRQLQAGQR